MDPQYAQWHYGHPANGVNNPERSRHSMTRKDSRARASPSPQQHGTHNNFDHAYYAWQAQLSAEKQLRANGATHVPMPPDPAAHYVHQQRMQRQRARGYSRAPMSPHFSVQPYAYHPHDPKSAFAQHAQGDLQPRFDNFSGKFSITPDPGAVADEAWYEVAARHMDRYDRSQSSGQQALAGQGSGPMPPLAPNQGYGQLAQGQGVARGVRGPRPGDRHAESHSHFGGLFRTRRHGSKDVARNVARAMEKAMEKATSASYFQVREDKSTELEPGTGRSRRSDGPPPSAPEVGVLPPEFMEAYEETCRELQEMNTAFEDAMGEDTRQQRSGAEVNENLPAKSQVATEKLSNSTPETTVKLSPDTPEPEDPDNVGDGGHADPPASPETHPTPDSTPAAGPRPPRDGVPLPRPPQPSQVPVDQYHPVTHRKPRHMRSTRDNHLAYPETSHLPVAPNPPSARKPSRGARPISRQIVGEDLLASRASLGQAPESRSISKQKERKLNTAPEPQPVANGGSSVNVSTVHGAPSGPVPRGQRGAKKGHYGKVEERKRQGRASTGRPSIGSQPELLMASSRDKGGGSSKAGGSGQVAVAEGVRGGAYAYSRELYERVYLKKQQAEEDGAKVIGWLKGTEATRQS